MLHVERDEPELRLELGPLGGRRVVGASVTGVLRRELLRLDGRAAELGVRVDRLAHREQAPRHFEPRVRARDDLVGGAELSQRFLELLLREELLATKKARLRLLPLHGRRHGGQHAIGVGEEGLTEEEERRSAHKEAHAHRSNAFWFVLLLGGRAHERLRRRWGGRERDVGRGAAVCVATGEGAGSAERTAAADACGSGAAVSDAVAAVAAVAVGR